LKWLIATFAGSTNGRTTQSTEVNAWLYSIAGNFSLRLGHLGDIEAFQGSLGNIQSDLALVRQKLPAFVRNNGNSPT